MLHDACVSLQNLPVSMRYFATATLLLNHPGVDPVPLVAPRSSLTCPFFVWMRQGTRVTITSFFPDSGDGTAHVVDSGDTYTVRVNGQPKTFGGGMCLCTDAPACGSLVCVGLGGGASLAASVAVQSPSTTKPMPKVAAEVKDPKQPQATTQAALVDRPPVTAANLPRVASPPTSPRQATSTAGVKVVGGKEAAPMRGHGMTGVGILPNNTTHTLVHGAPVLLHGASGHPPHVRGVGAAPHAAMHPAMWSSGPATGGRFVYAVPRTSTPTLLRPGMAMPMHPTWTARHPVNLANGSVRAGGKLRSPPPQHEATAHAHAFMSAASFIDKVCATTYILAGLFV